MEAFHTVSLVVGGYLFCFSIYLVESIQRTDPNVSISIFLDAGNVGAGDSCYGGQLAALCVILQESVGNCTQPDVALAVLIVLGRDIHTSLDALFPVNRIHFKLLDIEVVSIHFEDGFVEGRYEHVVILQVHDAGNEAESGREELFFCHLSTLC